MSNPQYEQQVDRGCRSKRAYASHASATEIMQKTIRNGRKRVGEIIVYRCRFCEFFHIGHAIPRHKRTAS